MASAAPPPVRPPVPAPIPQTATPAPVAADVMTPAPVAIRTVSLPASSATGPARPPASPAPLAATFASGGPHFHPGAPRSERTSGAQGKTLSEPVHFSGSRLNIKKKQKPNKQRK